MTNAEEQTLSKEQIEKAVETESIWDRIANDAKRTKIKVIDYHGQEVTLFFKELVGGEGDSVEKQFGPENLAAILSEKTFKMLLKGNEDAPEKDHMTRERWDNLPDSARNIIVMNVLNLMKEDLDFFQSTPDQTTE